MRFRLAACLGFIGALVLAASAGALPIEGVSHLGSPAFGPIAVSEAAPPQGGVLVQRTGQPLQTLTADRIAALTPITQRVGLGGGQGGNEWTGPLLWDVLLAAGVVETSPREQAHLVVRVTGADGYAAMVAVGEISPQLADRRIQLADHLNGAPLPNHGLRLIVPDDHAGARSVRDVVRIEVE